MYRIFSKLQQIMHTIDEIEEIDRRIDELVYSIYNIDANEREVIDGELS